MCSNFYKRIYLIRIIFKYIKKKEKYVRILTQEKQKLFQINKLNQTYIQHSNQFLMKTIAMLVLH